MQLTKSTLIECGPHRVCSRSVSWNCTGTMLAMGCSDRMARIWAVDAGTSTSGQTGGSSASSGSAREVLAVTGHGGPVTKVRFHPRDSTLLCTAATDQTVRLWDTRNCQQRAVGKVNVTSGSAVVSAEWCCSVGGKKGSVASHLLALTESDGSVYVYDARKLSGSPSTSAKVGRNGSLFSLAAKTSAVEACIFSPDCQYLIAGSSDIRQKQQDGTRDTSMVSGQSNLTVLKMADRKNNDMEPVISYPAHVGPIYTMQLSPNKSLLATGGSDAVVGIWDAATMCCFATVTRRVKFIRSVAFSHNSAILAVASEDDGVDLSDAQTGASVGLVGLAGGSAQHRQRMPGGAEEVSWHPNNYLLACARLDPMPQSPSVVVAKLAIS